MRKLVREQMGKRLLKLVDELATSYGQGAYVKFYLFFYCFFYTLFYFLLSVYLQFSLEEINFCFCLYLTDLKFNIDEMVI